MYSWKVSEKIMEPFGIFTNFFRTKIVSADKSIDRLDFSLYPEPFHFITV